MRIVSIANAVVSKNLIQGGETVMLLTWMVKCNSPAADTSPWAAREGNKCVFIPFAQEPFWFESERVIPIPCCVTLFNHLGGFIGRGGPYDYNGAQWCQL